MLRLATLALSRGADVSAAAEMPIDIGCTAPSAFAGLGHVSIDHVQAVSAATTAIRKTGSGIDRFASFRMCNAGFVRLGECVFVTCFLALARFDAVTLTNDPAVFFDLLHELDSRLRAFQSG